VFTAGKIAALIKQVIGDPMEVPNDPGYAIEVRDGINSTHTLDDSELAHARDRENLRDENSVIFRVAELKPSEPAKPPPRAMPLPANAKPIPSIKPPSKPPVDKARAKPRHAHEETRQLEHHAPPSGEDSGLLEPATGRKLSVAQWDSTDTDGTGDELENIGERTMVSAPAGMTGFMMDAGEDSVEATLITGAPTAPDDEPVDDDAIEDEEGPTLSRDMAQITQSRVSKSKTIQPPPALAAKTHAPAVSALRKPKASRRTPGQGVPSNSVLQQIVGSRTSEPMPVPQPSSRPPTQPPPVPQFPSATPGGQTAMGYSANDASGLPMGLPTPPPMMAVTHDGPAPHLQPYMHVQGQAPQYPVATQMPQTAYPQYPQMTPGALYQMGYPPPQPMSLTGQMRLFEVDEIPSQYKLGAARRRWFSYAIAGILAVSLAAIATFLIIRMTREGSSSTHGSVIVESVPAGADVLYDNTKVGVTPITIDEVPMSSRHSIKLVLPRHAIYEETIDIPKGTGQAKVMAILKQITGKLVVDSKPDKADILINGEPKGQTPKTIVDLDMSSAKTVEIRLKGFQPHIQELNWPQDGKVVLDVTLKK
jgi:hypothetical protein